MFIKLHNEYKEKLTPIIHDIDNINSINIGDSIEPDEQLSTISQNLNQINTELRMSYSILKCLLDNLEI
jgi:pentose-5-phosphate-3-epimerase